MIQPDEEAPLILLVDPSDRLSHRLGDQLADEGFDVDTVESAGACMTRLEDDPVAGVVSAYTLPDLDGIQLLRSLRVSYLFLPFVLFPSEDTGSESLASDAIAAGVTAYVPESNGAETVVSRIQESVRDEHGGLDDASGIEGQQRYRHLMEISPAAINVFDETGESIWCNRALLEMLGFESREEFIGHSIFDVIHPDDHDIARRELGAVIEKKEPTGPTNMKLRRPDGSVRHIRVSTAIGEFLGSDVGQAVAVDVTEREELERQMQLLDQWLRHNIRNEMTVIHGIAETIRLGMVEDLSDAALQIQEHADRLAEQASHERDIIRILAATQGGTTVTFYVADLLERVVADYRADHPDASVELVRADDFRAEAIPELEMAVHELLENAIEHNDTEEPTVSVEVVAGDDGYGEIRVADDGPGIPTTERGYLPLEQQVDQLNHPTGLGLILVYWILRRSGGTVSVSENEPRGSVVTLTVPLATQE